MTWSVGGSSVFIVTQSWPPAPQQQLHLLQSLQLLQLSESLQLLQSDDQPEAGGGEGGQPQHPQPQQAPPLHPGPSICCHHWCHQPHQCQCNLQPCELKIFIPFAKYFDLQRRRTPGGTLRLWSVLRATDPDLIIARLFMTCAAEEGRQPGNQS